jgi:superfamily II DNA helicase RecQ
MLTTSFFKKWEQIEIIHHDRTYIPEADPRLNEIRAMFYDSPFRSLQDGVCRELTRENRRREVFFVAPCGLGKSLCFVVAAYALKKITVRLFHPSCFCA